MEKEAEKLLNENMSENIDLLKSADKCDKYDYLTAVGCGAIGGMIDVFLVGSPKDSKLLKWTDTQVDKTVKEFAKISGWNPKDGQKDNVASAIGFLEKKFKVNYDQRYNSDVNDLFDMNTRNHHLMSLAHSPDVIGLFFSILNQFTSTATFVADGKLITIATDTYELQGGNFISKIFCGIANWFGHIMSDIAGSSGSRGSAGRGAGVALPFYELFQFCKFGKFSVGNDKQDLATIAVRAFQEGYDFRFGLTTAIPVVITNLSIRLIWAFRRHFQYGREVKECIPTMKHADLRIMLLLGNGTLCPIDGMDAAIRSGGNILVFFTRLNFIAWFKFVSMALKEVCIRLGIKSALQKQLEAFRRVNQAMVLYLNELERIDIDAYKKEVEKYTKYYDTIGMVSSEEELNAILVNTFEELGIKKPWEGDFDEFMSDKSNYLVFE